MFKLLPQKLLKHLKTNKFDQVERDENKDTPLHAIIRSEKRDKFECLIILMVHSDYGADNIDLPALFGNTALHLAVQVQEREREGGREEGSKDRGRRRKGKRERVRDKQEVNGKEITYMFGMNW